MMVAQNQSEKSRLYDVKKIFDERHDFEAEDIQTLYERWPEVDFYNIPVAWIVPIDTMLARMRYYNPVIQVRQEFGQLIVIHNELTENQRKIIWVAEKEISKIDEDLQ